MSDLVFVSYSRADHADVQAICEGLRTAGLQVWVDEEGIAASTPWLTEIHQAIRASVLVLVVDSEHWRASANCQVERAAAESLGKLVVRVDPARGSSMAVAATLQALESVDQSERDLADLLGRSARWLQDGRSVVHLATGASLRRFLSVARTDRQRVDTTARDYLTASRRSRARRRLVQAAVAAGLVALLLGQQAAQKLPESINQRVAATSTESSRISDLGALVASDPVAGVKALDGTTDLTGWAYDRVQAQALGTRLPYRIQPATRPSARPAAALPDGTTIAHGDATLSVTARGTLEVDSPLDGPTAGSTADSTPTATHHATAAVALPVTAMAWRPDGAVFAAAARTGIAIHDRSTGELLDTLRGLEGRIERLEWAGTDVIATAAGGATASWQTAATHAVPAAGEDVVALALRGEELATVDPHGLMRVLRGTQPIWQATVPGSGVIRAIAPTSEAWVIVRASQPAQAIIVRSADSVQSIDLPDCAVPGVAPGQGDGVVITCAETGIRFLDTRTGIVTTKPLPTTQLIASAAGTAGHRFALSIDGELFDVDAPGTPLVGKWMSGCRIGRKALAMAPDGQAAVQTAYGGPICTAAWRLESGSWVRHTVYPAAPTQMSGTAAAFLPQGDRFVLAYADGSISLYRSIGLSLELYWQTGAGWLNAIAVDDQHVWAAPRTGPVLRLDLSSTPRTEAERRTAVHTLASLLEPVLLGQPSTAG